MRCLLNVVAPLPNGKIELDRLLAAAGSGVGGI
jgi:hypothetical protein